MEKKLKHMAVQLRFRYKHEGSGSPAAVHLGTQCPRGFADAWLGNPGSCAYLDHRIEAKVTVERLPATPRFLVTALIIV